MPRGLDNHRDNGRITAAWGGQNYTLATCQPKDVCVPKGLDNRDNGRITAAWRGQNYTLATCQPKDVCVPQGLDNRDNGRVTIAWRGNDVTADVDSVLVEAEKSLTNAQKRIALRHKKVHVNPPEDVEPREKGPSGSKGKGTDPETGEMFI